MSNLGIALTKELCPVCGKEHDGPIVMNTVLTEHLAKKTEALHKKVIGFMKEPCDECRSKLPKGIGSWIIIVDESKSTSKTNPYRTGQLFGVTRDYSEKLLEGKYNEIIYMDYKVAEQLGFEINYEG